MALDPGQAGSSSTETAGIGVMLERMKAGWIITFDIVEGPYPYICLKIKLTHRNKSTKDKTNSSKRVSMSPCTTF